MCNYVPMSDWEEHPPVTVTSLTVYFAPLDDFDLTYVAPLLQRWAEKYPELQQGQLRDRPTAVGSVDLFGSSQWPFPAIVQSNPAVGQRLSYQADQFTLSWRFDSDAEDATSYPGYEVLSAELLRRFDEFVEEVASKAPPLDVQAASCNYHNVFDGIAGTDWIAEYLSAWSNVAATRPMNDCEYVGFRYIKPGRDETLGINLNASCQLDYEPGEAPSLDIRVVSTPESTSPLATGGESAVEVARELLGAAHSALLKEFGDSKRPDGGREEKDGRRG